MFRRIGWQAGLALSFMALGFIFIFFGWDGAAEKNCVQCQIPYLLSGGVAGLGFILVGGILLLFEAGRRVTARFDQRLEALTEQIGLHSPNGTAALAAPEAAAKAASANGKGEVVVGRSSFHRPNCRLVEGKEDLEYASREDATGRGLQPCRVCDPTREAEPVTEARRRRR